MYHNVLTCISQTRPLEHTLLQTLLPSNIPQKIHRLHPQNACDIYFNAPITTVQEQVHQSLTNLPIDYVIQPTSQRKKKLLLADMESTIIENEMLDELASEIGKQNDVANITAQAMNGTLDFVQAFTERLKLLRGISLDVFETVWSRVRFTPGASSLVRTMSQNHAQCILVSSGLQWFAVRVAQHLGFHEYYANNLEIRHGKSTGHPILPIRGQLFKQQLLNQQAQKHQLKTNEIIAVGDGANDVGMLSQAGLGFAYKAKPLVIKQTKYHIHYNDLTALLYAQGYNSSQIL